MKALILAAGQGTRLGRLTARRPKPMLPVRGVPVLAHTIGWLRGHGITEIAVNVHHCPDAIIGTFGDGRRFGVSLVYSHEMQLLGTAGAAKRLEGFLNQPFVVVYGDVLTNMDLGRLVALHTRAGHAGGAMTIALYHVPDPTQCGLVDVGPGGRVRRFVEKPPADQVFTDLAFSGVMVCEPGILAHIPADCPYDFGREVIPELLAAGAPVLAQPIAAGELLIDMGTLEGYLTALRLFGADADLAATGQDRGELSRTSVR